MPYGHGVGTIMIEPKEPKQYLILKFNLDIVARPSPLSVYENDEVKDLTQAQEILRKFRLVR